MQKIFAVANQKGGVGKTTVVLNLMAALKVKGFKVLGFDFDGQRNLTLACGAQEKDDYNIMGVLSKRIKLVDAIQSTPFGDLIPSCKAMSNADATLQDVNVFRDAIAEVADSYDFAVIDTAPSIGVGTVSALIASTDIIVPLQTSLFDLAGVKDLVGVVDALRASANPGLKLSGFLVNRWSTKAKFDNIVLENLKFMASQAGSKIFWAKLHDSVAVRRAQASLKDLFSSEPKAKVTQDFRLFVNELLSEKVEEQKKDK